jgi:hypothetical protein
VKQTNHLGADSSSEQNGIQRMTRTVSNDRLDGAGALKIESHIRQAIDGYAAALVPLIRESYGPNSVQQAWQEFMFDDNAQFTGDEAHSELFFSWFFHRWSPTTEKGNLTVDPNLHGTPPAQAYLARHSSRLDPLLRRYLEVCLETPFGFYQVVELGPRNSFRVRDMLSEMQIEVIDRLASASLKYGDIMFARLPFLDGVWVMDAISPVTFPSSFQNHLVNSQSDTESNGRSDQSLRKLYFDLFDTHLREQFPEIRNGNGEVVESWAPLYIDAPAKTSDVIFGPTP